MDDFGTGDSSLNLLRTFEGVLDKLKLDIKLTELVCAQDSDIAFIKHIIGLGSILNVKILAEGIETEQQKLAFIEMGCEFAQGYYYNIPLTTLNAQKLL
jgi:EAL domain-containing protein (putative c-di-GMP-specific phosphodiesterase class I)